jgi:hypothetical protein
MKLNEFESLEPHKTEDNAEEIARQLAKEIIRNADHVRKNYIRSVAGERGGDADVYNKLVSDQTARAFRLVQSHIDDIISSNDAFSGGVTEDGADGVIYKVFVNTHGDPEDSWATNGKNYETAEEAETAAKDLFMRWTAVKYWRVMDADKQTTYAEGP